MAKRRIGKLVRSKVVRTEPQRFDSATTEGNIQKHLQAKMFGFSRLLTIYQVCLILNCGLTTARKLIKQRLIEPFYVFRLLRIRPEALQAFLEKPVMAGAKGTHGS
jgi:excisionase family DNA binding protein